MNLLQDIRYSLRQIRKSPGFTFVTVLTLALGIGANTAIFSLLNAVMLKSVPVSDPKHLVLLRWSAHERPEGSYSSFGDCGGEAGGSAQSGCSFSYPMFKKIRSEGSVFSSVAAFAGPAELNLTGNGAASISRDELVSGDYFQTLGVKAAFGRTLDPADETPGAEPVVVLSYVFWKNAFGGDASTVGKTIRLNNVPFTIVGVAEPRFTRLTPGKTQDMWLPLTLGQRLGIDWAGAVPMGSSGLENAADWWLTVVARPKQDTSVDQAQAVVSLLFRNTLIYSTKPLFKDADKPGIGLLPVQQGLQGIRETLAEPLYVLMAVVGVVLLITCANVAGLMLARATAREREIAVRFALGATRGRIITQLLTESVMLSAIGGALGVILAFWGAHALAAFLSANWASPLDLDVPLDAHVLIFTVGVSMFAGIALGVVPAFRGTGVDVVPALKENAGIGPAISSEFKGRFRLRDSLVVGQVALSFLILVVSSLLVRTLENLKNIDPGFDTNQVLLFGIDPTSAGYKKSQSRSLVQDLQGRLAALPGVISVSYSNLTLLSNGVMAGDLHIEGQREKSNVGSEILKVGPGFFETMRIPLLEGRAFVQSDSDYARPVAIINEAFARQFFAGRNPIGLHLGTEAGDKKIESEIVGVVADTKYDQLRKDEKSTAFFLMEEGPASFELRTSSNPTAMIPAVRQVVSELDRNLPLTNVRTQSEAVDRLLFNERLVARLSAIFAALAVILACVGIYGLLSHEVSRRTREIGIRSALGAHQRALLALVVGQGTVLVFIGLLIGTTVTLGVTCYLRSMLYDIRPSDPLTFIATALLLIIVGLVACYIPARRAANVDPMVALRYE